MNVISYFNLIKGMNFSSESRELISLWEDSWKKRGWNTILIDEDMAKKNSLFSKLDLDNPSANFYKTINPSVWEYHRSCYCRLVAYCQYVRENGLTLYADYDVINYSFSPTELSQISENSVLCPMRSTVYLGREGVDDIERVLLQFNNQTFSEQDKRGSCNDMRVLSKYTKVFSTERDSRNNPYVSAISPDFSNNTPLIHYDGGCYRRGIDRKFSRLEIIKNYHKFNSLDI